MALAITAFGCGGSNSADDGDGGVPDDSRLPDDVPCEPGAQRCNGNEAQVCKEDGTGFETVETCSTFCQEGVCALNGLDVTSDQSLDGNVVVAGAVTVRSGATLSSPTGKLTIFADSLTIETGGSIAMVATGAEPLGKGTDSTCGNFQCPSTGGRYVGRYGFDTDSEVQPGAEGGRLFGASVGAKGGGVVKLLIKGTATIAGQITAHGENGSTDAVSCFPPGSGGSGGGILVVADNLVVSGAISAAAGVGGVPLVTCGGATGQAGGEGRVKLLHGATKMLTGTTVGRLTEGLAPPIPLKSLSHPDPAKVYNDGFLSFDVEWKKAFPSAMGYFVRLDQTPNQPPTAADGTFLGVDKVSFSPNDIFNGQNFVHIVSIDAQSAFGTVESVLPVRINTQGPSLSSSSHPNESVFSNNTNPFFSWTFPQGDENVSGTHYVLDDFGDTVPTTADTALPATQKQLLLNSVASGVHMLHIVSVDLQGRLTKAADHYRIQIGNDPGVGGITGRIVDPAAAGVSGATVAVNRGLFPVVVTASNGQYNIPPIPAGTYELSVKLGARSASKQITITSGGTLSGDMTLP